MQIEYTVTITGIVAVAALTCENEVGYVDNNRASHSSRFESDLALVLTLIWDIWLAATLNQELKQRQIRYCGRP